MVEWPKLLIGKRSGNLYKYIYRYIYIYIYILLKRNIRFVLLLEEEEEEEEEEGMIFWFAA